MLVYATDTRVLGIDDNPEMFATFHWESHRHKTFHMWHVSAIYLLPKFQSSFAVKVVSHKLSLNLCLCGCGLFSSSAQKSVNYCQAFSQLLGSEKAAGESGSTMLG